MPDSCTRKPYHSLSTIHSPGCSVKTTRRWLSISAVAHNVPNKAGIWGNVVCEVARRSSEPSPLYVSTFVPPLPSVGCSVIAGPVAGKGGVGGGFPPGGGVGEGAKSSGGNFCSNCAESVTGNADGTPSVTCVKHRRVKLTSIISHHATSAPFTIISQAFVLI